jgi:hypothetical protein
MTLKEFFDVAEWSSKGKTVFERLLVLLKKSKIDGEILVRVGKWLSVVRKNLAVFEYDWLEACVELRPAMVVEVLPLIQTPIGRPAEIRLFRKLEIPYFIMVDVFGSNVFSHSFSYGCYEAVWNWPNGVAEFGDCGIRLSDIFDGEDWRVPPGESDYLRVYEGVRTVIIDDRVVLFDKIG